MFPLKKLPRELRDKIYELMLMRGDLTIIARELEPSHHSDPEATWTGVVARIGVKTICARNTFILAYYPVFFEAPLLNIFLADRQTYSETWPIFYSQNTFAFRCPCLEKSSIEICRVFLKTRRLETLKVMHKISLDLVKGELYENSRFSFDRFEDWQHLCHQLGSELSLKSLTIRTKGPWEDLDMEVFGLSHPLWMEELYHIKGLKNLVLWDWDEQNSCDDQALIKRLSPLVLNMLEDRDGKGINATLFGYCQMGSPAMSSPWVVSLGDRVGDVDRENWARNGYIVSREAQWDVQLPRSGG